MQRISITNPQNIIDGTAKKYYFKLRNTGGPKGDKGDKGDTGQTGPQGPKGDAATVAVGSTTTLAVGQDATVENVGSIYNAVLNFGIPQGPQGPQGAKGDKGDTGAQGETGPRGPQGERGTNATVYVGTTTTTNPGTQARVYNSGTGSNAVLNFEIPRGDVGPMPTIAQTTGQAIDQVMSQKATTDALNTKQATIDSSHKLSADLVDDTSTTNKFVTAQDKTNWNAKQNALTAGDNITISGDTISTPAIAPEVVAELPTTGAEGKLYLTPKAHTTQTATGNPITATITEEAGKIESFQLDGDTYQQSYTGKNLCNPATFVKGRLDNGVLGYASNTTSLTVEGNSITYTTNEIYRGIVSAYIPVEPNTKYTLSRTVTSEITVSALIDAFESDSEAGWIERLPTAIFTTPNNCHYVRISFQNYASGTATISNAMVEKSATATSFEPYVGGQPSPNPDYPQPIQTVTGEQMITVVGKNLVGSSEQSYTNQGITTTMNSDGTITCKGTCAQSYFGITRQSSGGGIAQATPCNIPAGTYVASLTKATNQFGVTVRLYYSTGATDYVQAAVTKGNTSSATVTLERPAIMFYVWGSSTSVGQVIDETIGVQFEQGSTATSFAPYSRHTYPINLGKNLFDKDTAVILTGELNADKTYSTNTGKTIYIECKPNTTYSVQKADIGNRARLGTSTGYLPNGGIATNYVAMGTVASGIRYGRITSGQNDRYLWFTFARDDDTEEIITRVINSIQIEAGAQYSSYAPYKIPIELCKLGTYQDYIYKDGDDWKVHKATATYSFTGAETPTVYTSSTNTTRCLINNLLPSNSPAKPEVSGSGLSNYFIYGLVWSTDEQGIYANYRAVVFRGNKTAIGTTLKEVQTWLTANKPILYYALATATDTVITDTTLIAQLEAIRTASLETGANTITNTTTGSNLAGDMEIGYYGYDPRNRYDKWLWLDINNEYEQIGS